VTASCERIAAITTTARAFLVGSRQLLARATGCHCHGVFISSLYYPTAIVLVVARAENEMTACIVVAFTRRHILAEGLSLCMGTGTSNEMGLDIINDVRSLLYSLTPSLEAGGLQE
jgi:hypothetical protein